MLSALCTAFDHLHCRLNLIERWHIRLFLEPLRRLKSKAESKRTRNHLCTEFLATSYPLKCASCQRIVFGPNFQVLRCDGCSLDFHEACLVSLTSDCAKKVKGSKTKWPTLGKSGTNLVEHLGVIHGQGDEAERSISPSTGDLLSTSRAERGASPFDTDSAEDKKFLPHYDDLLSASDDELCEEEEQDPETCFHRFSASKLSPREQKRQCTLHEFWRTQLYHVHKLRLLHDQFLLRVLAEKDPHWAEAMAKIFPNLPELIKAHAAFYKIIKTRHQEQCPITAIGDVLLETVDDDKFNHLLDAIAKFLEAQTEQEKLWKRLRADKRFSDLTNEVEKYPALNRKRRQIESLKAAELHRVTRYTLLIDRIIKETDDPEELDKLNQALIKFTALADQVNQRVGLAEKRQRKKELLSNLVICDKLLPKLFPFLNEPKLHLGELVHYGDIIWRMVANRDVQVRVFLFSSGMMFITQQRGTTFELRIQNIDTPLAAKDACGNPNLQFCPILQITNTTVVNGNREVNDKERIDLKLDKKDVPIGLPFYRFYFLGTGPRDPAVEWDEWTHFLTLIKEGSPITPFKRQAKNPQNRKSMEPSMLSNNNAVSPRPSTVSVDMPLEHQPSPEPSPEPSENVPAASNGPNEGTLQNGIDVSFSSSRDQSVSPYPTSNVFFNSDTLITPKFASAFGFEDVKEMSRVGNAVR